MKIMCLVADRKELVNAISEEIGEKMKYQGPPTFAFKAGDFTVERDGTLDVENPDAHEEVLRKLTEEKLIDNAWDENREVLQISMPLEQHTVLSLINLTCIFYTKSEIINKAIGATRAFEINERFMEIIMEQEEPKSVEEFISLWEECGGEDATRGIDFYEGKINFTGFPVTEDSDWIGAFTELAARINKLALDSKRISVKKEPIENEKYYFRVWLVRIGFGGKEHKMSRKLLLSKLSGHTAFRAEEQKELHKKKYQELRAKEVAANEKPEIRN